MVKPPVETKSKLFLKYGLSFLLAISTIAVGNLLVKQKKMIIAKKVELVELNRDLKLLDQALADWEIGQEKINLVLQTLPANYQEVSLAMSEVEAIAKKTNQNLLSELPDKPEVGPAGLPNLKISIKTDGSFSNLIQMLSLLSNTVYYFQTDSLQITKNEGAFPNLVSLRLYLKP